MSRLRNFTAARWPFLMALVFGPLIGCTSFQQVGTSKWLETRWLDKQGDLGVNQVLVYWDNRVRITQDTQNNGAPLPGVVGRLFLFNDESTRCVEAHGEVSVQMHDVTNVQPGTPPRLIAQWNFDPHSLKRLKRTDSIGQGYTLFLPWESYHADVKKIKLQLCYTPENGAPYYTSPSVLSLHSADETIPILQQTFEPGATPRLGAK